jgi:hypothetical protein
VGFVRTGQIASVQLDAFNYIKYGAIDGVVENIVSILTTTDRPACKRVVLPLYCIMLSLRLMVAKKTYPGVVTSAQELMSIVPIGKLSLKAEVKILNKDVGFVRTGQIASFFNASDVSIISN